MDNGLNFRRCRAAQKLVLAALISGTAFYMLKLVQG